jgi:16S rRNA (uracil1498-N3)-methyltransferase
MGRRRRIPLFPGEFDGASFHFSRENSRRILKTLRMKPGDKLEVFDESRRYLVELVSRDRTLALGKLLEVHEVANPQKTEIILMFGLVRPGPVEEILRHCSELGVDRFLPLISSRCSPAPSEPKKRWRMIVLSAVAQCGRQTIPGISGPQGFDEAVKNARSEGLRIILSNSSCACSLMELFCTESFGSVTFLVGPEGGFTGQEENLALENGFQRARLTPDILRTETAAIAACATVACHLESQGNP